MKVDLGAAKLSDIKDFTVIPSGVYLATMLEDLEDCIAGTGTKGLKTTFRIDTPGMEVAPGVPRTLEYKIWESKEMGFATPRMRDFAMGFGVNPESQQFDTSTFVGRQVQLTIETRTYDRKDAGGKATGEKGQSNEITKFAQVA